MKLRTLIAFMAPLLLSVSAHAADATLSVRADVPDVLELLVDGKKGVPANIEMKNDPAKGLQDAEIAIQIRTNNPGIFFYVYLQDAPILKSGSLPSVPLTANLPHSGTTKDLGVEKHDKWSTTFFSRGANHALSNNGLASSQSLNLKIRQTNPGPLQAGTYTGTIKLLVATKP